MLSARTRGFTLIELMFGLALFALVMMLALPSFTAMLNNGRLRDTAASIMAGLQATRSEALRRNQIVEFVLTADDVDDTSVATVTANNSGPNWAIRVLDATATPVAPLVEARSALEGSNQTDPAALYSRVLAANLPGTTTVRFDALGRTNVGGVNTTFDVTPSDANLCRANGGDLRCVRVVVTPSGRVRMCDPSIDPVANPNDTRAC
jgi:type IV fimbrial biogenesis protein FimT